MPDYPYWRTQAPGKPLFPDIEWSKPEQYSQKGRLGIIGGNKLGFAGVAESFTAAFEAGAGECRVVLPNDLRATIPKTMTDVIFAPGNPSGSLSRQALPDLLALGQWSNVLLFAGDAGRNSETAILYEDTLRECDRPAVVTRDAIDLIKASSEFIVNRPNTVLVASFAQVQKLFQAVYYPKMLAFSMQLLQLVEAVHKFTITYPVTLVVLHKDTLVVAHNGQVTTTAWSNPMAIWRGMTAARAATYLMWSPKHPLESITASVAATE